MYVQQITDKVKHSLHKSSGRRQTHPENWLHLSFRDYWPYRFRGKNRGFRALCATIFNPSPTQNTFLFTDGNKGSVCEIKPSLNKSGAIRQKKMQTIRRTWVWSGRTHFASPGARRSYYNQGPSVHLINSPCINSPCMQRYIDTHKHCLSESVSEAAFSDSQQEHKTEKSQESAHARFWSRIHGPIKEKAEHLGRKNGTCWHKFQDPEIAVLKAWLWRNHALSTAISNKVRPMRKTSRTSAVI